MKTTFNTKTLWAIVLVSGILGFGSAGAHNHSDHNFEKHSDSIQTVHIHQARMTEAQKIDFDMENQSVQTVMITAHRIG